MSIQIHRAKKPPTMRQRAETTVRRFMNQSRDTLKERFVFNLGYHAGYERSFTSNQDPVYLAGYREGVADREAGLEHGTTAKAYERWQSKRKS